MTYLLAGFSLALALSRVCPHAYSFSRLFLLGSSQTPASWGRPLWISSFSVGMERGGIGRCRTFSLRRRNQKEGAATGVCTSGGDKPTLCSRGCLGSCRDEERGSLRYGLPNRSVSRCRHREEERLRTHPAGLCLLSGRRGLHSTSGIVYALALQRMVEGGERRKLPFGVLRYSCLNRGGF